MSTVRQALQSALEENGGAIPFDTFMDLALHHPQDGYYARHVRGIGAGGDFTTVPQISQDLGRGLAGWLRSEAPRRGWRKFHVIECGPGSGALAKAVMESLGWLERRRISLHLVETSEPLRTEQARTLGQFRPSWHATAEEALAACGGKALIYHNEFFDAFPCRVFRKQPEGWNELYLRVSEGKLREVFETPSRPVPPAEAFHRAWPEGQRIEVFESVTAWIKKAAHSWQAGAMMVIDYGGRTEEIYHRRPGGTLRAYRGQQRLTGNEVYELPGRQDITAEVNFDDLAVWGRAAGWRAEAAPWTGGVPAGPTGAAEAFRSMVFTADQAAKDPR